MWTCTISNGYISLRHSIYSVSHVVSAKSSVRRTLSSITHFPFLALSLSRSLSIFLSVALFKRVSCVLASSFCFCSHFSFYFARRVLRSAFTIYTYRTTSTMAKHDETEEPFCFCYTLATILFGDAHSKPNRERVTIPNCKKTVSAIRTTFIRFELNSVSTCHLSSSIVFNLWFWLYFYLLMVVFALPMPVATLKRQFIFRCCRVEVNGMCDGISFA